MPSPASAQPPGFLVMSDAISQTAFFDRIKLSVEDSRESAMLCAAMTHPYLRPLLELYYNNGLDAYGAVLLQGLGHARREELLGRVDSNRSKPLAVISLTENGLNQAEYIRDSYCNHKWFVALEEEMTDYACRDLGAGICIGIEFLETAIEKGDVEVLRRVVDPISMRRMFQLKKGSSGITDQDRLSLERLWSPRSPWRQSAKIIDLDFESTGTGWTSDDLADVEDFITDLHCIRLECMHHSR